ncbi:MAG: NADH-quinone oxidoreductase subunit J [Lysobacterales bacterium]
MLEQIVFFVLAGALVASALAVISARNPVYAALFLILCFFTSAAIWLLLEVEFLAIVLILVYVGAVMVLFLFVVMMLDVNVAPLKEGFARYLPVGLIVALAMLAEMLMVISAQRFGLDRFPAPPPNPEGYSNTKELGEVLYTQYVYPFEIAAVILLVAIVAAIALTLRRRPKTRYQTPSKQVMVRKEDRLKVVSMPAEKPGVDS